MASLSSEKENFNFFTELIFNVIFCGPIEVSKTFSSNFSCWNSYLSTKTMPFRKKFLRFAQKKSCFKFSFSVFAVGQKIFRVFATLGIFVGVLKTHAISKKNSALRAEVMCGWHSAAINLTTCEIKFFVIFQIVKNL